MSLPEVLLWQHLRGSPQDLRFRRQHPIGPYVVDFYCARARLIIEIDGENHLHGKRPEQDVQREAFLTENGHRIARYSAADVARDVGAVADSIFALVAAPLHHPAGGPPPRTGEDF